MDSSEFEYDKSKYRILEVVKPMQGPKYYVQKKKKGIKLLFGLIRFSAKWVHIYWRNGIEYPDKYPVIFNSRDKALHALREHIAGTRTAVV